MKIKTIRNAKGEIIATFETGEEGALVPTVEATRGRTIESIEVESRYYDDPKALYAKLNKK